MKIKYFLLFFLFFTFGYVYTQIPPALCIDDPLFFDTSFHQPLAVNEFLLQGYNGECWVEVRNCRAVPVDLGGYYFSNTPTNYFLFQVLGPRVVSPYGLDTINLPFTIPLSFGTIYMSKPDSSYEHNVTCDAMHVGESLGFCGMFLIRQIPTPNTENTCVSFPVSVQEILYSSVDTIEWTLYDMYGREVFSSKDVKENSLGYIPKGIYILSALKKDNSTQRRLICF